VSPGARSDEFAARVASDPTTGYSHDGRFPMSRLVVAEFVSLDGVMQDPAWTGPYWNDGIAKVKQAELFASDALLLGRVTYEGFAAAWPGRSDEDGYAERINSMPKHVASTTLDTLAWESSSVIQGDVAEGVAKLKQQAGGDLLVFGSTTLARSLAQHRLVDAYRLVLYPVVLGSGTRLFADGAVPAALELVETTPTENGVIVLTYAVTDAEIAGPIPA
jgi:dihydrofolate reductase